MRHIKLLLLIALSACMGGAAALAQTSTQKPPPPSAAAPAASTTEASKFSQEELEQMLAPIALYPDSLLSQVLMASTYPLEIVQADRWAKANSGLKGEALAKALEDQTWDASVKSLVNFPDILAAMSEKLDLTTKIGDAFLADQKAVLNTVQRLRARAKEAGNLESSEKLTVKTEPAPAGSTTQVIVIESPDPQVIYVPTYNPTVVYGTWPYPAYPPPVYYPPPSYATGALIGFGIGYACGAAWGYGWGDCDWHGGDVDIDIDQNFEFNQNIDRERYKAEFKNRGVGEGRSNWQHDPSHRRGVEYRDKAAANRFGGSSRADAVQSREAYRGKADAGRANLSRDAASGRIPSSGATRPSTADRTARTPATKDLSRTTLGPSTSDRATSRTGTSRSASTPSRSTNRSAISGSNRGSSSVSRASSRGSVSRSGGGGARGGGGGGRGRA